VTPWAAGDTSGKSRLRTPATQRLAGHLLEGTVALAFAEDPDQHAGQECARDGDEDDEVPGKSTLCLAAFVSQQVRGRR
jgi:hypothetical protein